MHFNGQITIATNVRVNYVTKFKVFNKYFIFLETVFKYFQNYISLLFLTRKISEIVHFKHRFADIVESKDNTVYVILYIIYEIFSKNLKIFKKLLDY